MKGKDTETAKKYLVTLLDEEGNPLLNANGNPIRVIPTQKRVDWMRFEHPAASVEVDVLPTGSQEWYGCKAKITIPMRLDDTTWWPQVTESTYRRRKREGETVTKATEKVQNCAIAAALRMLHYEVDEEDINFIYGEPEEPPPEKDNGKPPVTPKVNIKK